MAGNECPNRYVTRQRRGESLAHLASRTHPIDLHIKDDLQVSLPTQPLQPQDTRDSEPLMNPPGSARDLCGYDAKQNGVVAAEDVRRVLPHMLNGGLL